MAEYLLDLDEELTNYLDDFLFIAVTRDECDRMMTGFLLLCKRINCPVSDEKTEWSTVIITFLGTLLDGERHCLCIPEEKRVKALNQLRWIKSKKKATVKEIQKLTGLLNFLNRALVLGHVFTWRMYAKIGNQTTTAKGFKLKQHHHVSLDAEFKLDAGVWELFLENAAASVLCRPFVDRDMFSTSHEINFYTDASGRIGYGTFFNGRWLYGEWDRSFLQSAEPSIEYLELFALTAGILTWGRFLTDTRIIIFCDSQAVVEMVNKTTSNCKNCMHLLRLLVLDGLRHNRRLSVKYVRSADNILADSLSRLKFDVFWKHAPAGTEASPWKIPRELWPIQKFWIW